MAYAWLIPALPAASFIILLFAGKRLGKMSHFVSIAAMLAALGLSASIFLKVVSGQTAEILFPWLSMFGMKLNFGIMVDSLTAVMLVVVTSVASLVQIYSIGYMAEDRRYHWYYALLSLFTAAMLLLVLSANYVQMYASWELVGVCSYLLIGFWFEKRSAADAAKKAFITTRIGDVGFMLGLVVLYYAVGSLDISAVLAAKIAPSVATVAAILLFMGAVGKSAQFPLHVWLPDAMEGPTPVSALIHAATMVAAGVYLVARSYPIFAGSEIAMNTVATIGAITALMAATIALVQSDIKRILAYSTISQLGLMMAGLGVGAYSAAIFHLTTHAFFKALLFLGAGSVIHATHTQDIFEMGGLWKKMKVTAAAFLVGGLALAGFPGLSGFWSKEGILTAAYESGHYGIFAAGLITSLFTAFYITRLFAIVFMGPMRADLKAKVHESPKVMALPLMVLIIPAGLIGFTGSPIFGHAFQEFIRAGEPSEPVVFAVVALSIAAALSGIAFGLGKYRLKMVPSGVIGKEHPLYSVPEKKFYFDEIYRSVIVSPVLAGARLLASFDSNVIDGVVNGVAKLTGKAGELSKRIQGGQVQSYGLTMIIGIVLLTFWILRFVRF